MKLKTPAFFNCFNVKMLTFLLNRSIYFKVYVNRWHKGKFMLGYKPFKISDEIRSEIMAFSLTFVQCV